MKLEEHFKDTLERAVANEPPVIDSWTMFERRVRRDRGVRAFGSVFAIAALIVAAVLVVPRLGRSPEPFFNPNPNPESPSPSPSPSTDAFAGWNTFKSPTPEDLYSLRYPGDWRVTKFENMHEVLAPGQPGTPEGMPTAAVSIEVLMDEEFDTPALRADGFDRSTGPDGRPYVLRERLQSDGGTTIDYRFDWSSCVPSMTKGCIRGRADTLIVSIELSTRGLQDSYRETAERIVSSIAYTGGVGPFSFD